MIKWALLLTVAVAMLAQWLVPAAMIARYESVLQQGTSYRFNVQPVDPADPFRGRFVRLNFAAQSGGVSNGVYAGSSDSFSHNDTGYALLAIGSDGLANVQTVLAQPPAQGDYTGEDKGDYIKVTVWRANDEEYGVQFPFNRYYAEEKTAPKIEQVLADTQQRLAEDDLVTADVRIKDGVGVIAGLYVGEVGILEFLRGG